MQEIEKEKDNQLTEIKQVTQKAIGCENNLFTSSEDCNRLDLDRGLVPKDFQDDEIVNYALKKVFGTDRMNLASSILLNAGEAIPSLGKDLSRNLILGSLEEMAPKDLIEARLATLETVLYSTSLSYLRRAEKAEMLSLTDHYMRHAQKLVRLHNETVDALNKHKRGGEQKVVVQHVNVNGGQAAIMAGNFEAGGGGNKKQGD